jgi:ABC-2 type transport system permease protein
MRKILSIVKREYLQRVRSRLFIFITLMGPLLMLAFAIVPGFVFNLKTGEATRIAVIDQSGVIFQKLSQEFSREDEEVRTNIVLELVSDEGRGTESIKQKLRRRVQQNEIDGFVIIPENVLTSGRAEYLGNNLGDVFTVESLNRELTRAVVEERMNRARIDRQLIKNLSEDVSLNTVKISEEGEEKDSGESFGLAFFTGFLIYFTITMYGQTILSSVVEEKSTRIAEVLFSSITPLYLILGKLIGVSLVALTQYLIWGASLLGVSIYGAATIALYGMDMTIPNISVSVIIYFMLFFLLGYFVYATIYILLGSIVTTPQEGGQIAMPVVFLFIIAFYLAVPVIRSPDSQFSFWMSLIPFFSPITMMVRIVSHTPPMWQILLSISLCLATIIFLVWMAARIYRIGMLMYGKRATIPEVFRWLLS